RYLIPNTGSTSLLSSENDQSILGTSGRIGSTSPKLITSSKPRIILTITARCDHGQGFAQIRRYRFFSTGSSPGLDPNGVENKAFWRSKEPSDLISCDIYSLPFSFRHQVASCFYFRMYYYKM